MSPLIHRIIPSANATLAIERITVGVDGPRWGKRAVIRVVLNKSEYDANDDGGFNEPSSRMGPGRRRVGGGLGRFVGCVCHSDSPFRVASGWSPRCR